MSKVKFTTTLNDKLLEQAKIEAIKLKISTAQLIENLLQEYFKNKNNE